jgi:hypothetical protein
MSILIFIRRKVDCDNNKKEKYIQPENDPNYLEFNPSDLDVKQKYYNAII